MKNKTGSHVGVIISFAVFITFLIFLFLILKPALEVNEEKEATLNNMGTLLLEYLNSELTTASIQINRNVGLSGNCVGFNQVDSINVTGLGGNNIFVKNSTNSKMKFDWQPTGAKLLAENNGVNRFFKVYASEGINSQENVLSGCQSIPKSSYTAGIAKTEDGIFEQKILAAIQLYKTNYTALKQNIGISSGEFGFDFVYNNGTILSTGETNQKTNIFAKEIPVNYLDTSLNSNAGSIIIKTWQ